MQSLWAGSVLFFFPTPSSVPITLKSLASQASVTLRIHGSASCYYDCLLLARKDKKRTREMRFSAAPALIVIRKPDPPVQPTLRSMCQQTEGLKEETGTDQMPSIGVELLSVGNPLRRIPGREQEGTRLIEMETQMRCSLISSLSPSACSLHAGDILGRGRVVRTPLNRSGSALPFSAVC